MLGFSKDSPDSFFDVFLSLRVFKYNALAPNCPLHWLKLDEMVAQNGLRHRVCRLEIGSICCQIKKLPEVMVKGHMYVMCIYIHTHTVTFHTGSWSISFHFFESSKSFHQAWVFFADSPLSPEIQKVHHVVLLPKTPRRFFGIAVEVDLNYTMAPPKDAVDQTIARPPIADGNPYSTPAPWSFVGPKKSDESFSYLGGHRLSVSLSFVVHDTTFQICIRGTSKTMMVSICALLSSWSLLSFISANLMLSTSFYKNQRFPNSSGFLGVQNFLVRHVSLPGVGRPIGPQPFPANS